MLSSGSGAQRRPFTYVVAAACAGLTALHGLALFASSGRDDSHITYWAAKALAELGRVVNYNGDSLEQSSSLLHVALLALLHRALDGDLATLGAVFSIVAASLTTLACWRFAVYLGLQRAWLAALLCALSPYVAYWAVSGLETTLAALLGVLVLHACFRLWRELPSPWAALRAAAAIAAFVAVRPEAVFILSASLALLLAWLALARGLTRRPLPKHTVAWSMGCAGLGWATFGALGVYRLTAFGRLFPQPVYAKAGSLSLQRVLTGADYLLSQYWIPSLVGLTCLALWAILDDTRNRNDDEPRSVPILASFAAAHLAFVIAVGGDWMEGGRFLVPLVPPLSLLALDGVERLPRRAALAVAGSLAFLALADSARFALADSTGAPLIRASSLYRAPFAALHLQTEDYSWFERANRIHLRDIPVAEEAVAIVGELLARGNKPVRMMSIQMGLVSYHLASRYLGEVELIDMRGLVTRHFTDCAVTQGLPRKQLGIAVSFEFFFQHQGELHARCGIDSPELILAVSSGSEDPRALLESHGYTIVYEQVGSITTDGFGGAPVPADQVLAVRSDLAATLARPYRLFRWPRSASM